MADQARPAPGDLTYAEVAEFLGVDPSIVCRMTRRGDLPARRVFGVGRYGGRRITRQALLDAISEWVVPAERTTA